MKYTRIALICFITLLFVTVSGVQVIATDSVFSTDPISENEEETFLENIELSFTREEPKKEAIKRFSVNQSGEFAIGSESNRRNTVCVYTGNGEFKYAYKFKSNGSFGVELKENVLYIHFVRSNVSLAVDDSGKIVEVKKIQDTKENNSHWQKSIFSDEIEIDGKDYRLTNDLGFFNVFVSDYSKLIVTNKDGETTVLYDVSSMQLGKKIVEFVFIGGIVVFVIIGIIRLIIKGQKENK